jgi:hypothetical protein
MREGFEQILWKFDSVNGRFTNPYGPTFYIDEFPENDKRFEFTLEDCRRVTETERQ